jgi:hypothetical protein
VSTSRHAPKPSCRESSIPRKSQWQHAAEFEVLRRFVIGEVGEDPPDTDRHSAGGRTLRICERQRDDGPG